MNDYNIDVSFRICPVMFAPIKSHIVHIKTQEAAFILGIGLGEQQL